MTRLTYLITFLLALSSTQGVSQYPDSLHQGELRSWLKLNTYDAFHSDLGYSEARRQMYSYVDEVNGQIYCIYTDFSQQAVYSTFPNPINAEHLVPQSLFGSQEPMRSDIHVIRPSHESANSARANYPLGEIPDELARWHGIDSLGSYLGTFTEPQDNSNFSEGLIGLFEPQEDRKGDIARQFFYFFTMYPGIAGEIDTVAEIQTLYDWHIQDPVDGQEMIRNNRAEEVQGNRNPYIDFPDLAFDAWIWTPDPCEIFSTAPVDLTKSFAPVPYPDGVVDRAQVKWYKSDPQMKYAPEDSAGCDIQFWPIRDLATSTPIVDGDTTLFANKKKPGRYFFKWPLKFQHPAVFPSTRYRWRVRCGCNEGLGAKSPWSEIKYLNTPAYDPVTNIFTPPGIVDPFSIAKELIGNGMSFYPNPAESVLNLNSDLVGAEWMIMDMTGRTVKSGVVQSQKEQLNVSDLDRGAYLFLDLRTGEKNTLILR